MQFNQLELPPFSVLVSLYIQTDPEYLNEALSSIWNSQSLKPSQIVLVKDGPLTPQLNLIIGDWARLLSERFVIVELSKNLGLASALNQGLKYCEFELVARINCQSAVVCQCLQPKTKILSCLWLIWFPHCQL